MSSGAQQLQNDYKQVKELIAQYPSIKLIQTDGEPPESYDIEYRLKGYKSNPDGTESPVDVHQVRITLPFGYPHFPPTAKPLTPIFHPDIDPDAIRIADFWAKSNSLPELILHIGHMICGTVYNPDEPFNQRAFDWYEERKSWMPFDILEPGEVNEDESDEIEFKIAVEDETPDTSDTGDDELEMDLADLIDEPEGPEEDITLQFDEADDLMEPDNDAVPEDFELPELGEETATAGAGIENLDDLPLEDDELNSIDLGDFTSDREGPGSDIFDLASEPAIEASEDIELSDLSDLQEDTSQSPPVADMSALSEEGPADAPVLEPDDAAAEVEELSREEEAELADADLQLDDDFSTTGTDGGRSLRMMIEEKKIFTAKKALEELDNPAAISDLKDLKVTITEAITEAEGLYKKADKLEQKGELEKAGLVLDLVANIAVDYPGLEFARNRIRENKVADDQEKTTAIREEREKERQAAQKITARIPIKSIAAGLILLVVGAGGYVVYTLDAKNIKAAGTHFAQGEQLIEKKNFKQARDEFSAAQAALDSMLFLKKGDRLSLQQKIDTIVGSQAFKEGIKGRVLYEGKYVPIKTAKAIDKFKVHLQKADDTLHAGKVAEALVAYEKSIEFAKKAGLEDQVKNIQQTISNLKFQLTLAEARKAEEDKEWKKAAETYQKALELGSNLSKPEDQKDIAQRLAAASFRHELDASKRAFTSSEWQKTIEMLQRARKILDENPSIASEAEKKELNRLLVNSRLYHILSTAKKAYELQRWDQAINEYQAAIALLDKNAAVLGRDDTAKSRRTIEKTIVMTRLAKEQSLTTKAVANKDLEATLTHYRNIVQLIDKSSFKEDPVLAEILENASKQVIRTREELLIKRRVDWLTENFEKYFRQNYPSAKSSDLLSPKVTFIKRDDNIMIFNMSCVERKQGRTFRLELNYQYNIAQDSWKLYSGKL